MCFGKELSPPPCKLKAPELDSGNTGALEDQM